MRGRQNIVAILLVAGIASGCGSMTPMESKQTASVVDYLYSAQQPPQKMQQASITELNIPLRIGIAFVPGVADPKFGISEVEQIRWSSQIKAAFERYPFVGDLVMIPTAYLKSGGGFDNLETTVFDVRTQKLLFRAPGTSTVKGSSTWVKFSESARDARAEGFDTALQQLIPNVDAALQAFRKQAHNDPAIKLSLPAGYDPNAWRRLPRESAAR
jgi:hypothetical protein